MPSENEHLTRLRRDYAFSRDQGPNYMVMTTQEAVREALLIIERLKDEIENPEAYAHRRTEHR